MALEAPGRQQRSLKPEPGTGSRCSRKRSSIRWVAGCDRPGAARSRHTPRGSWLRRTWLVRRRSTAHPWKMTWKRTAQALPSGDLCSRRASSRCRRERPPGERQTWSPERVRGRPGTTLVSFPHCSSAKGRQAFEVPNPTGALPMRVQGHSSLARRRKALLMTLTEESAIAAAAIIGESRSPKDG